jgi:hypothetical protein
MTVGTPDDTIRNFDDVLRQGYSVIALSQSAMVEILGAVSS